MLISTYKKRSGFILSTLKKSQLSLCILFGALFLPWHAHSDSESLEPQLTIRGEAQLSVSPDQVTMVAGVLTEANDSKEALNRNSLSMKAVMDALVAMGIDDDDISTRNFNVQPVWSSRPRNVDSSWRAKIIAYRVSNDILVKTKKLDLIGDLITTASEAGANKIQSVSFGLANPRLHRKRALSQAVMNAREDADTAVDAAGVKIKGVKKIQIDQSVASVERVEKAMLMRSAVADSAPSVPISSGDVTVRASVYMTYEISQ